MKEIFFVAGIFFLIITYGQDNYFIAADMQHHDRKIRQEGLATLYRDPVTNTNIIRSCAAISSRAIGSFLYKIWLENRMKSVGENRFHNYEHTFTVKNTNRGKISKTGRNDRWQIGQVTQERLNELRDFLEGPKANYRAYFD